MAAPWKEKRLQFFSAFVLRRPQLSANVFKIFFQIVIHPNANLVPNEPKHRPRTSDGARTAGGGFFAAEPQPSVDHHLPILIWQGTGGWFTWKLTLATRTTHTATKQMLYTGFKWLRLAAGNPPVDDIQGTILPSSRCSRPPYIPQQIKFFLDLKKI